MRLLARHWAGVSSRRLVVAALLLLALFAAGSCKSPTSPSNCNENCSATLTACNQIAMRNAIAPAAAAALCSEDYDTCRAKCK
jgi:hypothetical protein